MGPNPWMDTYGLEEWDNIQSQSCANAVINCKKRLLEVIRNKGHSTNY